MVLRIFRSTICRPSNFHKPTFCTSQMQKTTRSDRPEDEARRKENQKIIDYTFGPPTLHEQENISSDLAGKEEEHTHLMKNLKEKPLQSARSALGQKAAQEVHQQQEAYRMNPQNWPTQQYQEAVERVVYQTCPLRKFGKTEWTKPISSKECEDRLQTSKAPENVQNDEFRKLWEELQYELYNASISRNEYALAYLSGLRDANVSEDKVVALDSLERNIETKRRELDTLLQTYYELAAITTRHGQNEEIEEKSGDCMYINIFYQAEADGESKLNTTTANADEGEKLTQKVETIDEVPLVEAKPDIIKPPKTTGPTVMNASAPIDKESIHPPTRKSGDCINVDVFYQIADAKLNTTTANADEGEKLTQKVETIDEVPLVEAQPDIIKPPKTTGPTVMNASSQLHEELNKKGRYSDFQTYDEIGCYYCPEVKSDHDETVQRKPGDSKTTGPTVTNASSQLHDELNEKGRHSEFQTYDEIRCYYCPEVKSDHDETIQRKPGDSKTTGPTVTNASSQLHEELNEKGRHSEFQTYDEIRCYYCPEVKSDHDETIQRKPGDSKTTGPTVTNTSSQLHEELNEQGRHSDFQTYDEIGCYYCPEVKSDQNETIDRKSGDPKTTGPTGTNERKSGSCINVNVFYQIPDAKLDTTTANAHEGEKLTQNASTLFHEDLEATSRLSDFQMYEGCEYHYRPELNLRQNDALKAKSGACVNIDVFYQVAHENLNTTTANVDEVERLTQKVETADEVSLVEALPNIIKPSKASGITEVNASTSFLETFEEDSKHSDFQIFTEPGVYSVQQPDTTKMTTKSLSELLEAVRERNRLLRCREIKTQFTSMMEMGNTFSQSPMFQSKPDYQDTPTPTIPFPEHHRAAPTVPGNRPCPSSTERTNMTRSNVSPANLALYLGPLISPAEDVKFSMTTLKEVSEVLKYFSDVLSVYEPMGEDTPREDILERSP